MTGTHGDDGEGDLGAVLDEHIVWFGQWHRAVFFHGRKEEVGASAPAAFAAWLETAREQDLAHQPALERLAVVHEQMHRLARMLLLKAVEGWVPDEDEYEAVISRFEDFVLRLRRVERAFGAAASGLDPLTGMRGRRGMNEELAKEFNRYSRTGQPFCMAIGDIDRFKSVNDRFGHDNGDRVLGATAACIGRSIRSFDEAFRMGGEEFLICLKGATMAEGFAVVDRLRHDLENSPVQLSDGQELSVTASFGLVQSTPGRDIDQLIVMADKALYQAKHGGRNQVVRYGIDKPPPVTDGGPAMALPKPKPKLGKP
ncbi:diguanylate cyclase [uncultured Gammaproteobacteria bacterium]